VLRDANHGQYWPTVAMARPTNHSGCGGTYESNRPSPLNWPLNNRSLSQPRRSIPVTVSRNVEMKMSAKQSEKCMNIQCSSTLPTAHSAHAT